MHSPPQAQAAEQHAEPRFHDRAIHIDPKKYTGPFLSFLTENPTVFHAVAYYATRFEKHGFKKLSERESWVGKLGPGKYYTTRNGSSLVAFIIGSDYEPGNGAAIIAGHVDALTARLKPISKLRDKAGFVQLVARIPTLAPHFGAAASAHSLNKETQMVPIIGLESTSSQSVPKRILSLPATEFASTQPARLVSQIMKALDLKDPKEIVNWELELYDTQPAQLGGLDREFIFAGRIDDKLCSFAALEALLATCDCQEGTSCSTIDDSSIIQMVGVFDDEEIGSLLRQGARGNFLPSVLERITESMELREGARWGPNTLLTTYARSFLVSADVTHAVNPNFLEVYLEHHAPQLNVGVAISADANGHMATDAVSTAFFQRVAEEADCQLQVFQIRNDTRSGGTVGPMLSAKTGIRAVDAGIPQLSMHSIRATTGALDPGLGVKMFLAFLQNFEAIDDEFALTT
ncbi:MAG: hypothetical protein M1826_006896 [Phylliscum demangeonii]|nr:MAG: hypothetical protein M1826_006896 [Phylliscum demangeonii]